MVAGFADRYVSGFETSHDTERSAGHALFKTFYRALFIPVYSPFFCTHNCHGNLPVDSEIFRNNPPVSEILLSKP